MSVDQELVDTLPVKVGSVIAGKYRVEGLLAAGGMGAVFRAHHEILDKPVAIKLIRPELASRRDIAQRFLREARAAAKIQSDYVARVTDVDLLEEKTPYMVMEFLEGDDLATVMDAQAKLPIAQAVDYALEALLGLEAAHAKGVVHRDLKPSNLFIERREGSARRVKLLDFGISKVMEGEGDDGLKAGATTGAGQLLGTPRYMSPEQVASSKNVDLRTDLWAVGMILYEMVSGSYPFEGWSSGTILAKILTAPIAPLAEMRPEVPAELSAVVAKSLAKERDERYLSAGAMIGALGPFASKRMRAVLLARDDAANDNPESMRPPPIAPVSQATPEPPTRREGPPRDVVDAPTKLHRSAATRPTEVADSVPGVTPPVSSTEVHSQTGATLSKGSSARMFAIGLGAAAAIAAAIYFLALKQPTSASTSPATTTPTTTSAAAETSPTGAPTNGTAVSPGAAARPERTATESTSASAVATASASSNPVPHGPLPVGVPINHLPVAQPPTTGAPTTSGGLIRTRD